MSRYDAKPTHMVEVYTVEVYTVEKDIGAIAQRTDRFFYPNHKEAKVVYDLFQGHLTAKVADKAQYVDGAVTLVADMMGEGTVVVANLSGVRLIDIDQLWAWEADKKADEHAKAKVAAWRAKRGLAPK